MYQVKKSRRNKYNAKSTCYNGIYYHSKFEAGYAEELDWRIKAKDIKSVERQVKISLDVNGKHITNYFIDFVIIHNDDSFEYVEVKGFETEVWRLKWKLFEALIDQIHPGAVLTVVK